ncbi:Uncharacterized membrane protein [Lentibacillus persicus]|uniref:Uncharacterized membrane protein n=1 Tax=Lentibacillus persicus TaxID=640948 RepID=A0A1I1YTK1_9BACI|nr:DUF4870 domain-containing protein [Lentibacillus persicus]SFE22827.1 Uncharacterized membrane protein [Lentibacillus persicus]
MRDDTKTETSNVITGEESADVKDNKGMAILAYIIFFIPLIAAKDSEFAMYHANQGLNLFLLGMATWIIGSIVPIIGWLIVLPFGTLFWFILLIIGIINASNGKKKQLPLIGSFKLIN